MDKYTVEFRVYGKALNIPKIEEIIGLKATTIQIKREKRSKNSYFDESMWGYGITLNDELKEFISLEDGINELLDVLLPIKKNLLTLMINKEFILWCGHFHNTFGSGSALSNNLLKKLLISMQQLEFPLSIPTNKIV